MERKLDNERIEEAVDWAEFYLDLENEHIQTIIQAAERSIEQEIVIEELVRALDGFQKCFMRVHEPREYVTNMFGVKDKKVCEAYDNAIKALAKTNQGR